MSSKNLLRNAEIKQAAARLGIDKIDAASSGGYLNFSSEAKVDPVLLVGLVQKEGHTYKLRGAQRLQFRSELDDIDRRYAFVERLLAKLSANNDAAEALAG